MPYQIPMIAKIERFQKALRTLAEKVSATGADSLSCRFSVGSKDGAVRRLRAREVGSYHQRCATETIAAVFGDPETVDVELLDADGNGEYQDGQAVGTIVISILPEAEAEAEAEA